LPVTHRHPPLQSRIEIIFLLRDGNGNDAGDDHTWVLKEQTTDGLSPRQQLITAQVTR
jgi:hypothetical protein